MTTGKARRFNDLPGGHNYRLTQYDYQAYILPHQVMTQKKRFRDLAEFFEQTGRTQEELAATLGVSQSHLSLIARGLRRPSLRLGLEIEKQTGVPVESLVTERVAS